MESNRERRERQHREHEAKYERLAQWLGIDAVKAMVPFTKEQIELQLSVGDEHLNGLPLPVWDKQHGEQRVKPEKCQCCGQMKPAAQATGMWALVLAAITRDREAGRNPLPFSWSLSDTVCVLKHVATHHVATNREGPRDDQTF